jgi:uncharacterized protein YlaI
MIYYEVLCYSCKKIFRVYEGSLKYKQFKERKSRTFCCEDFSIKYALKQSKISLDSFWGRVLLMEWIVKEWT